MASAMEIDEDLHSRQLAVYGREAFKKMAGTKVLISGLNGLGCEIAKNVILAGVKAVTLHDTENATLADLGSNFYLAESDIGKNRADGCAGRLQELNSAVTVNSLPATPLEPTDLASYSVVVFTGGDLETLKAYDTFCHNQSPPIAFIKTETRGVFANIFCDFGKNFTVNDVDGEEVNTGIIASIGSGSPALVTCVEDERIDFEDGDMVVFKEVQGMTKLNDGTPRKITKVNKRDKSFLVELEDGDFGAYTKGGVVSSVKQPKTLDFKSLSEAIEAPGEFLMWDFAKMEAPAQLHVAFLALDAFRKEAGALPRSWNTGDGDKMFALANDINAKLPEGTRLETVDEATVRKLAAVARGDLSPMAAVIGGMVAQEVLKAVSGKFHPITQWFHFDSVESLPSDLTEADCAPIGSRYDGQIACLGQAMQRKLGDMKLFLVGAGALGCEFLKNYAAMGVSCGSKGSLVVTDDDTIEKSNLSRQFLFRDKHIHKSKSLVASEAALEINSTLKVKALQNRVSPETESVFDDGFWEGLDLVTNALDNVNARLYVDSRCVYFQRPLLESGTLGPKCNTQMVLPLITENYGASRDPPMKEAPMCTLHSFPHNIDHCLTWARSEFIGHFEKTPADVNGFLSKPDYGRELMDGNPHEARECLQKINSCLVEEPCKTFDDSIRWARLRFEDYNVNRIKQLTFTFPEDAATSSGAPFWSPPKRFPRMVAFDAKDPVHQEFIIAAANLRSQVYGIAVPDWSRDGAKVGALAAEVPVPEFVPRSGVKIETDEKKTDAAPTSAGADDLEETRKLMEGLNILRPKLGEGYRLNSMTFEKDDDTNFHMDFITAAANLRARVYSIEEVDKLNAKLIAGRIIPAIATATALAAGLVCLELYKVVCERGLESYRNAFINLAIPLFTMSEPMPPVKTKFKDMEWSIWERWVIPGEPTLQDLVDWFQNTRGITASIVSYQSALLYAPWMPAHKARLPRKLVDLAREIGKVEFPAGKNFIDFVVACEDDEGEDVDVPLVSVRLNPAK